MSERTGTFNDFSGDDGTITTKIKALQDMGVLEKPEKIYEASGFTTSIKTYPFVKPRHPSINKVLGWLKKDG